MSYLVATRLSLWLHRTALDMFSVTFTMDHPCIENSSPMSIHQLSRFIYHGALLGHSLLERPSFRKPIV